MTDQTERARPANGIRVRHNESTNQAWTAFERFCAELKYGEIERLTIQNGVPIIAELTKKKVKFIAD